jgi:hypothetical protein
MSRNMLDPLFILKDVDPTSTLALTLPVAILDKLRPTTPDAGTVEADIANEAEVTELLPNGPNTLDAVTNEAVNEFVAHDAVPCSDPVIP